MREHCNDPWTDNPSPCCGGAGGSISDALIGGQSPRMLRAVVAPKLWGTRCLDASTGTMPVELYKFFSSVGAFMGAAAQANYAIANSCLDSWASLLGSMGTPGNANPPVFK